MAAMAWQKGPMVHYEVSASSFLHFSNSCTYSENVVLHTQYTPASVVIRIRLRHSRLESPSKGPQPVSGLISEAAAAGSHSTDFATVEIMTNHKGQGDSTTALTLHAQFF